MSISRKFITWTISIIFVLGLLTAYLYYRLEMQEERERIESFAGTVAPLIEESLATYMLTKDINVLERTLYRIKSIKPIGTLWIINREGIIKGSTVKEEVGTRLSTDDPGCRSCHHKGHNGLLLEGRKIFRWVQPVSNGPQCHKCHDPLIKYNGVIITDFSLEESEKHLKKNIMRGLLIYIPSLLTVGFVLLCLSKKVVIERLDRVADTIKRFREGDCKARIPLEGRDEITELEESFNEMAGAINDKEQALKKSESGLLEAQRIAHLGNWEWDIVNNELRWSDEIYHIFGLLPHEFGASYEAFLDAVHPDDREFVKKSVDEALVERKPYSIAYRIVLPEGIVRIVHEQAEVFFDETEKPVRMYGTVQDITERKKAEQKILRSYELQTVLSELLSISLKDLSLGNILQQALDLIIPVSWLSLEAKGSIHLVQDEPGMLIMMASKGLPGHLLQECSRLPFGRCLCGRAALTQDPQFADCVDDRHDISYEGMEPHGHYCIPIIFAGEVLGVMNLYLKAGHRRDEGECNFLKAFTNVLAGIIQRRRAEEDRSVLVTGLQDAFEKVSRSQKEWQETFDSITDLIVILDRDYRIIRSNRAVAEYFGLEMKDVINKTCHDIFHALHAPIKGCPFKQALDNRQSLSCEVSDEKNKKTFHVSVFPYYSAGGEIQGMVHIARDITEEKENEMRLIMSERLASLGQMASGIAHEINNPLAAIAGCTEGLLKRVGQERFEPELFRNYLKIIGEEILRCKNITSSMLSFVRKTTYDTQDVDIHKTLDKTIEIIGFQGRLKEVELIKDYTEGLPLIRGSEGELRQVFLAIIINALDAMEDRGTLFIETGIEEEKILIKITDAGPGISPEHISRIFDPFYTTKGEKGGTGLGLSIANKIVNNHRGSIEVSSEEGKGTAFIITLPI